MLSCLKLGFVQCHASFAVMLQGSLEKGFQSSATLENLGEQSSITTVDATGLRLHRSSYDWATQTDSTSHLLVDRTQTDDMDMSDEELIIDSASLHPDNLCEENNDVKFHPLVIKHKCFY